MTPKPYDRARQAYSQLQRERLQADCNYYLPDVLKKPKKITNEKSDFKIDDRIKALFPTTCQSKAVQFVNAGRSGGGGGGGGAPLRIGAVLSGGQAPGGHNIVVGIYDQAKRIHLSSAVFGFLDGPHGIFSANYVELTDEIINGFRNTGGFDMLGSGRHKIETSEQFENSLKTCLQLDLDGLVVIGGDDSNTNGAVLAEYFRSKNVKTKVVGCPKTIDGDLKVPPYIPVSFGFDTACRTYAELVGNVAVDSLSTQKYYHFVRLMGRSASNIAVEVALQTCANVCLIGEEVAEKKQTLKEITESLVEVICKRKTAGRSYGVILLPEGLIEFIPEFEALIKDINEVLGTHPDMTPTERNVVPLLSAKNGEAFLYLPAFIREQLLLDRDPHGNVQVAKIETEKLLAATVRKALEERFGTKQAHLVFNPQFHAFGYEGRAGLPSFFDSSYCYALGATATTLLHHNETGMIASVKNLLANIADWECGGVPVTALCVIERRKGKDKAVIEKALVELEGAPFKTWVGIRDKLAVEDCYRIPGPLQFSLDCPHSQEIPMTLQLELGGEYVFGKSISSTSSSHSQTPQSFEIDFPTAGDKFLHFGCRPRAEMQIWRSNQDYQVPAIFENCRAAVVISGGGKGGGKMVPCSMPCAKYVPKSTVANKSGAHLVHLSKVLADGGEVPDGCTKDVGVGKNKKIGIVYCGRQTPGAADVVVGLADCLARESCLSPMSKNSSSSHQLLGFVGGTAGFYTKSYVNLSDPETLKSYRKTGGMELLGRSEDKFSDVPRIRGVCKELGLDALVLVGGCTSATTACFLAEELAEGEFGEPPVQVVSVPASMGGELTNAFTEQPLGFDSTTKATARLVGNTAIDGSSARKYWYFLRSMEGPTHSSHVTLEVGLQTKPNFLLLGEKVLSEGLSLREIVAQIADVVEKRWKCGGKNFGTVLIPDGLLFNVLEMRVLISELDKLNFGMLGLCSRTTRELLVTGTTRELVGSEGEGESEDSNATGGSKDSSSTAGGGKKSAATTFQSDVSKVAKLLTPFSKALLEQLPEYAVHGMLDAKLRGNAKVNLASIETERMLADMVKVELKKRTEYGGSFSPVCQFLGYQSRCTMPSSFDCNYGYALGLTAASLVLSENVSGGYLAIVSSLTKPVAQWQAGGVPLAALLKEDFGGAGSAVATSSRGGYNFANSDTSPFPARVFPARVDMTGLPFKKWTELSEVCAMQEMYENPGPVQFAGDTADRISEGLQICEKNYFGNLSSVKRLLEGISGICSPGCNPKRLKIAGKSLENLKLILEEIEQ